MENQKKDRKENPWRSFCKEFADKHPDLTYKQVMVEAKKSYTPLEKPEKIKKEKRDKSPKKRRTKPKSDEDVDSQ